MPHEYRYVPLTRADLPMLEGWLAEPHVARWWGSPPSEVALLKEELASGKVDMRIVHADAPFAYVQDYRLDAFDAPFAADLPEGARGLDMFLGDPAYLGQGHAAAFLRQRAQALIADGAPCVAVDPDPANERARKAYARAGFRDRGLTQDLEGQPVWLMTFDRGAALQ